MRSLAFRIGLGLVIVPVVLVSAVVTAALVLRSVRGELILAERDRLELSVDLREAGLRARMDELNRDVAVLASTPPLQGLVRSTANGGLDPLDGSTSEMWKNRLTTIFVGVLENKSEYVQARVIRADGDGSELVRVERDAQGRVVAVPNDALQAKGDEPYVRRGFDAEPGSVMLSDITLNREHGRVEQPHRPMMRATALVVDQSGEPFALVVVNVAVQRLLDEVTDGHGRAGSYSVYDRHGHALAHPERGVAFSHEVDPERASRWAPRASDLEPVESRVEPSTGLVRTVRRIPLNHAEDRYLVLVGEQSFAAITEVLWEALRGLVLWGVLLVLAAVILAAALAWWVVHPIARLTASVEHFDPNDDAPLEIPTGLGGEAGRLAEVLKASLDALTKRSRSLEQSNAELEQFAYVASHDLQEPLRTITNFTMVLRDEYSHLFDEDALRMMEFIVTSCARMSDLIHGLLDFGRLRREAVPEVVDVGTVVERVLSDISVTAASEGADVQVGPLPVVHAYPVAIRVLIQNLVGNALKYRRPGVAPKIRVTALVREHDWELRVSDNGIGIAPEHREQVFRIFQRLHRRDDIEGTGIGLTQCRKVVQLHGGEIWIEDGEDGGTMVVARLEEQNDGAS